MRLFYLCVAMIVTIVLVGCQQEPPAPEKEEVATKVAVEPEEAPAKSVEKRVEPVEMVVESVKEQAAPVVKPPAEEITMEPAKSVESVVVGPEKRSEINEAVLPPPVSDPVSVSKAPEVLGDAAAGAKLTKGKCGACHYFDKAKNKVGPSLMGIYGKAPSIDGVPFSVWDSESLDPWLENPKAVKPKTKMGFKGVADKAKRDNIIAYLKTL